MYYDVVMLTDVIFSKVNSSTVSIMISCGNRSIPTLAVSSLNLFSRYVEKDVKLRVNHSSLFDLVRNMCLVFQEMP